jgi:two-component system, chemotaxis family, response regulator Rcp1
MNECKRMLQVLLVEDNQGDAFLIKEMLRDTGIDLNISVAENGQKALDMLNRAVVGNDGSYDLVILDLNLPKVHGLEVLSYMKSMHGLKQITVVIMTGSLNRDDETKARAMGANNYLIKPSSNEEFESILHWMKGTLSHMAASGNLECGPAGRGGTGGYSAMICRGANGPCIRQHRKHSHSHRLGGPALPSQDWQERMDRPW